MPVRNVEADCVNEVGNMEDLWDAATIQHVDIVVG